MRRDRFQDLFQEVRVAGQRTLGEDEFPRLGPVWRGVEVARRGREAAKVRAGQQKSQILGDFTASSEHNDFVVPNAVSVKESIK